MCASPGAIPVRTSACSASLRPTAAIALVAETALSDPAVPYVIACARLDNLHSQRAFAKAGFRKERVFDDAPNGLHVLLVRERRSASPPPRP
jgi:RimJ/RimL family protein N-acetyltransferase